MQILPCTLQLRHSLTKTPGIEKAFTKLKPELKIRGIPCHAVLCIGDENFRTLQFGGPQLLRLLRIQFVRCNMGREKFLVRSYIPFQALDF